MANILVIDDDRDLLKLVQTVLSRTGHTLTLAVDGPEGLNAAETKPFDLAIIDVMMPGIDGYEVTRRLRANPATRALPILILTARTQVADQMSAAESGADGYLGKPLSYKELSEKVDQMLADAAKRAAAPPPPPPSVPPPPAVPGSSPGRLLSDPPTSPGIVRPFTLDPLVDLSVGKAAGGAAGSGRVIVLLGLRGGVGTTTLAANLAGALTRAGRRVCITDLSPNGGHMALQFHLRPNFNWGDWQSLPESKTVGQTLVRHQSGIFVLTAPPQPVRRCIASETLQIALSVLSGFFTDIIVDAAPLLDDSTCTALNVAKYTLITLSPDLGSVRTTLGTLRALGALAVSSQSLRLVLNHPSPEPGLAPAEVEKALSRPLDWVIPYDRAQTAALAQGLPLTLSQPNAPLAAAIANSAAKLL